MSDIHVEQLDAVIKAYKNKKRLMRHGDVVNEELFEMGLGFFRYPNGTGKKLEKIESFEDLAKLKLEHGLDLVKIQEHQIQAFVRYLKLQDDTLYKKGFDALENIKSEKDLGVLTIEMEAAVAAAIEFQVSWDRGAIAEAKLEMDVSMELDGKYAKFSSGAKIAIDVKAQLELTKLSLEATVDATAEATLESKPISIGDTSYMLSFYTQFKAYAKAEAVLEANIGVSSSTAIEVTAKGKLFAGVGASAEVGIVLDGIYNKEVNPDIRLLAKANLHFKIEAGALLSFGADFGSEEVTEINKVPFFHKAFSIDIGALEGASLVVNIFVLEEITDDIQEKIIGKVKELSAKLIGEKFVNLIESKYETVKKEASNIMTYIGADIFDAFHNDSYAELEHVMDANVRRIEDYISDIGDGEASDKLFEEAEERLSLITKSLTKYQARIKGVRADCAKGLKKTAELLATGDMDDKTFFTRSSKILDELEDLKDKIVTMFGAIEEVTDTYLKMVDLKNMLDDHLIEEDLLTSENIELLANRAKMNELLQSQTYMNDSLDYIAEALTDKLLEEAEKRK